MSVISLPLTVILNAGCMPLFSQVRATVETCKPLPCGHRKAPWRYQHHGADCQRSTKPPRAKPIIHGRGKRYSLHHSRATGNPQQQASAFAFPSSLQAVPAGLKRLAGNDRQAFAFCFGFTARRRQQKPSTPLPGTLAGGAGDNTQVLRRPITPCMACRKYTSIDNCYK